jgi:hypothetical protein
VVWVRGAEPSKLICEILHGLEHWARKTCADDQRRANRTGDERGSRRSDQSHRPRADRRRIPVAVALVPLPPPAAFGSCGAPPAAGGGASPERRGAGEEGETLPPQPEDLLLLWPLSILLLHPPSGFGTAFHPEEFFWPQLQCVSVLPETFGGKLPASPRRALLRAGSVRLIGPDSVSGRRFPVRPKNS